MTLFLKIAKSIVVHFAHICAYGVETVKDICTVTKCCHKQDLLEIFEYRYDRTNYFVVLIKGVIVSKLTWFILSYNIMNE